MCFFSIIISKNIFVHVIGAYQTTYTLIPMYQWKVDIDRSTDIDRARLLRLY